MTGMRAKRKKRESERMLRDVVPAGLCPNCGHPGAHFVPPSFGEPGFYACKHNTPPERGEDGSNA